MRKWSNRNEELIHSMQCSLQIWISLVLRDERPLCNLQKDVLSFGNIGRGEDRVGARNQCNIFPQRSWIKLQEFEISMPFAPKKLTGNKSESGSLFIQRHKLRFTVHRSKRCKEELGRTRRSTNDKPRNYARSVANARKAQGISITATTTEGAWIRKSSTTTTSTAAASSATNAKSINMLSKWHELCWSSLNLWISTAQW